jgi:hypothetical protein
MFVLPGSIMVRRIYHVVLGAIWVGIAATLLLKGLPYYVLPLEERPWSPGHGIYDPTGRMGNRLGIAGAAMMVVGVGLYGVRKRWRWMSQAGRLRDWLSLHIFLCTLGPFLVVLHTSFRVGGLVAIAFWSMILVVVSGIVGRYVYIRIPRALDGGERTLEEIATEQRALLASIREQAGEYAAKLEPWFAPIEAVDRGVVRSLGTALVMDLRSRREQRQLARLLHELSALPDARRQVLRNIRRHRRLSRELALLQPFQRLFRYWHAYHLPLALAMLLVLAVHIGVAIAFGYAWTQ